jgi:hypothetical protein
MDARIRPTRRGAHRAARAEKPVSGRINPPTQQSLLRHAQEALEAIPKRDHQMIVQFGARAY